MNEELWGDLWMQAFLILGLISGCLTWDGYKKGLFASSPREPARATAAVEVVKPPPQAPPPAPVPAPAPARPPEPAPAAAAPAEPILLPKMPETGAKPAPALTPKRPGLWIVDAKGGADSDSASLSEVLASAQAGDAIQVKPGIYEGNFNVARKLELRGTGAKPGDTVIRGSAFPVVALRASDIGLENLTVEASHAGGGAMVLVEGQRARLAKLWIKSAEGSTGVEIAAGDANGGSLTDSTIDCGRTGVAVGEKGSATLANISVRGCSGTGVGAAAKAFLSVSKSKVADSGGFGIMLSGGVSAQLRETSVSGSKKCGLLIDGAAVGLQLMKVNRNDCGIGFLSGGRLDARWNDFSGNANGAVMTYNDLAPEALMISEQYNNPTLKTHFKKFRSVRSL